MHLLTNHVLSWQLQDERQSFFQAGFSQIPNSTSRARHRNAVPTFRGYPVVISFSFPFEYFPSTEKSQIPILTYNHPSCFEDYFCLA